MVIFDSRASCPVVVEVDLIIVEFAMKNVLSLCATLALTVGCNKAADFSSGSGVKSLASVEDEDPITDETPVDETCLLGTGCVPSDEIPEECLDLEEGAELPKGCPVPENTDEDTTDEDTTDDETTDGDTTDEDTTDDETTDEDTTDECTVDSDYECEEDPTEEEGPSQNGPSQSI
jgi:hypothetical protein